jgi:hypothetical protein
MKRLVRADERIEPAGLAFEVESLPVPGAVKVTACFGGQKLFVVLGPWTAGRLMSALGQALRDLGEDA